MWKEHLEKQDFNVISINAWETDFDDEPLIPIVSSILDEISSKTNSIKVKEALDTVLGVATLTANQLIKQTTGVDIHETAKNAEAKSQADNLKEIGSELYKTHSFKEKAYQTLKTELSNYIETLDVKPLIIFVDELDRVRPDYSVKFLEAIKHIFSVQGICFVLAVDRKQLEISVKQLYGNMDFESYYRRFITREVYLPEVSNLDLKPFIELLGQKFFDEKREVGVYFPFKRDNQNEIIDFISDVCRACEFVPREIEAFFRILSQFMAISESDKKAKIEWVKASLFLIGVSIHNPDLYHKIGQGTVNPAEIETYINGLSYTKSGYESRERHFLFLAMSFLLRNTENGSEEKEIALICLEFDGTVFAEEKDEDLAINNMLQNLRRGGTDRLSISAKSTFQQLYSMIEDWRPFIE